MSVSETTLDRVKRAARGLSLSWVIALPVLAVGMTCFWAQRDTPGTMGSALKLGALLVPLAFPVPAVVCDVVRGVRLGLLPVVMTIGRGLLIGVLGLVLGAVMLFIEVLRPESAFGFFADAFRTGHLIAAGLPTLIAVAAFVWSVWDDSEARRPVVLVGFGILALLGPALWMWSSGIAFEAMRYANADNALLLAQAITLGGLVLACMANAALSAFGRR